MVVVAVANMDTGCLLVESANIWNKMHPDQPITCNEDLGYIAFGNSGRAAVMAVQGFMIIFGSSMFMKLMIVCTRFIIGPSCSCELSLLVIGPVVVALSLLRDFGSAQKASRIGFICMCLACLGIVVQAVRDQGHWESWSEEDRTKVLDYDFSFPSIWIFSGVAANVFNTLSLHSTVLPMMSEMKDKSETRKAFALSIAMAMSFYMSIYVLMYGAYGKFLADNVLDNIKRLPLDAKEAFEHEPSNWSGHERWITASVASAGTLISMIVILPIRLLVLFKSLQSFPLIQARFPDGSWANVFIRICFVIAVIIISILVPTPENVAGLMGSLGCTSLTIFMPILYSWKIRQKCHCTGMPRGRIIAHTAFVGLGLVTMVAGFGDTICQIVSDCERSF